METNAIQKLKLDPAKLLSARGDRSREEVARALGIGRQQLWQIETGLRNPSAPILVKICFLYNIEIKDIVSCESFCANCSI